MTRYLRFIYLSNKKAPVWAGAHVVLTGFPLPAHAPFSKDDHEVDHKAAPCCFAAQYVRGKGASTAIRGEICLWGAIF
jgi:hypothetical protein